MHAILGPFISLGVNESFFVMFLLFTATFFFVKFTALNRLTETIVERDHRIEGRRHEVHKLHREYQDIQSKLDNEMRKARLDATATFTQIKEKAVAEQRSIVNAARETAAREIKNVRANVAERTAEEMKTLEKEIPTIAKMIVDQILDGSGGRRSSVDNESTVTK